MNRGHEGSNDEFYLLALSNQHDVFLKFIPSNPNFVDTNGTEVSFYMFLLVYLCVCMLLIAIVL